MLAKVGVAAVVVAVAAALDAREGARRCLALRSIFSKMKGRPCGGAFLLR